MRNVPANLGRWVTVLFLVLASLYLFYYHILRALSEILAAVVPWILPFILALFLAALLDPLVDWLERRLRLPRTGASLIAVLGLLLVLVLVVTVVLGQISVELTRLATELPRYGTMLKDGLAQLNTVYHSWELPPQIMTTAEASIERIIGYCGALLSSLVQGLFQAVGAIPGFLISVVVVIVATFFFSRDKIVLRRVMFSVFPWLRRPKVASLREDLGAGLVGYFKAEGFLVTLTALQVLIGLYLFRVRYALSLSILTALLDVLPVVGPGTIFLPWAVWMFLRREYGFGLALIVLYATITIVRQVLEPRVVGKNLGLHPLAALASIYMGVKALGLAGAVLGPLVVMVVKAAYEAGLFSGFLPRGKGY